MGQFKPMVKMMTTEPSVELKLKKGGAVKTPKKMMNGGVMRGLAAAPSPGARGGMPPAVAPARPSIAMRRKAMMARPMMKEGGESKSEHAAEMKKMMGTEAKLKKHASMPASKAHKGLKTGGVVMGQAGFKEGGVIGVAASEKGAKGYVKTKMDTASGEHHTPKKTGDVAMGKPGGYKSGGSAKYAKGGGVEGNVSTSKPGPTNTTTGEVKKGNAGGYKRGGKAKRMAEGGISGLGGMIGPQGGTQYALGSQGGGGAFGGLGKIRGGAQDIESGLTSAQQAIGSPTGAMGTGGLKKGGAAKKRYATGGLVDSGRAVAMPRHPVSKPVANDLQSGTFKKGGGVQKKAYGGAC